MSNDIHGPNGTMHPVTDRGRNLALAVREARAAGYTGAWIAPRISDGKTDGKRYDTRADAVRHQLHEEQCAYLPVPEFEMPDHEASAYLELHERAYKSGMRFSDPEARTPYLTQSAMPALNRAMRRRNLNGRAGNRVTLDPKEYRP